MLISPTSSHPQTYPWAKIVQKISISRAKQTKRLDNQQPRNIYKLSLAKERPDRYSSPRSEELSTEEQMKIGRGMEQYGSSSGS